MSKITAKQLVDCFRRYCAEKWGYVWGLNGELYTQAMADRYKASKRSTSKWRNPATYWTEDCKQWIGRMAADCSGGIVSAMREYNPSYGDRTANTFYNQCTEKGPIKTIPEVPGLCVWRDGHIGIYEGGGNVIEFRGTEYGCVRTKLAARNFTNWGRLRDVDYSAAPTKQEEVKLNLKTLLFTQNNCYKSGKRHTVKGIMVHSTGANNPKLSRYVGPDDGLLGKNPYNNHWNQPTPDGRRVCVHGFIGKLADGSIATYQTLPWEMVGWHSGSGKLGSAKNANNSGYIGFEICEDGLTDASYFNAVYREAVELCAMLCKQYGIKPEKPTLICHSEGHALGIASNHADVMHWFPKHGKSMDTFRADVKAAMGGGTPAPVQPTQPAVFAPYTVRVTASALNIRKGPGTGYATNGSIKDKGVYTIVAESTGPGATKWGKLKSGAGWISLDYCQRR